MSYFLLFIYIAAAAIASLARQLPVVADTTHVNTTSSTAGVIPNTYIVALRCKASDGWGSTLPHVKFYRYMRSQGILWTTTKEYRNPILHGAVIRLHDPTDYGKLAVATGVESISPVQFESTPASPEYYGGNLYKRTNGVPWSHTVTGVDRLHTDGYFGQGVTIGIINGGVDYNHRLLGDGFGRGRKVVGGWDFVGDAFTGRDDSSRQPSGNPMDRTGHGTHVAGIIGAEPDLQRGIIGVAYGASINAYRVAGRSGVCRNDIVIDAFLRAHDDGNDVIVLALYMPGGWGRTPLALEINRIAAKGRVVVVAAGNFGQQGPWITTDLGSQDGVISVGNIVNVFPHMPVPHGLSMNPGSCQGPSNSLQINPIISAPGTNIHSTWPISLGSYSIESGSSQAAAFVAGAAALWLEARGRSSANALLARSTFVNTALPILRQGTAGNVIETASWQGAGLIQVHTAATISASMRSAELLLNDTVHAKLAWRVRIKNNGRNTVTYTVTHEPASTTTTIDGIQPIMGPAALIHRPATAYIPREELTVEPGRYKVVEVHFQPPISVDPATFPVYSGYLKATGSDGSVLQSVYLGLAASMNQVRVLDNTAARLGTRLPCLANRQGDRVLEGHVFSMTGINRPMLLFRLAFGSPFVRLDLVDARVTRSTDRRRSINPTHILSQNMGAPLAMRKRTPFKSLFGFIRESSGRDESGRGGSSRGSRSSSRGRGWGRGTGSRRGGSGSGRSSRGGGANGGATDPTPIIGTLFEEEYMRRNPWDVPNESVIYWTMTRTFMDGSQIPDGLHRLQLRALKPLGNRRSIQDYEFWTSISFQIRRA